MSVITNINQFKLEIRRCRELAIQRSGYTHHVFVGEVDDDGCDFYHYTFALISALKLTSPFKIMKTRLNYDRYRASTDSRKIFNFDNGEVVIIVDRKDYPNDEKSEEVCIKRAKSRLGEEDYSVSDNNCECYVNCIFSNDNTSEQIKSSKSKQTAGDAIDGVISMGILHPLSYLASGAIHFSQKKTPSELSDVNTKNSNAQTSDNQKEKKHKGNKTKETQKEKTGKKSMNVVNNQDEKTTIEKKGSTELQTQKLNEGSRIPCLESRRLKEESRQSHLLAYKEDLNRVEKESGCTMKQNDIEEMKNMHSQKAPELTGNAEKPHLLTQNEDILRQQIEDCYKLEEMNIKEHAINKHSQESEKNLPNAKYTSRNEDPELNNIGLLPSLARSTDLQIPFLESRRLKEETRQSHLLAFKEDLNRLEKESGCTMKQRVMEEMENMHSQKAPELTENAEKPHLLTQNEDVLRQQIEDYNKLEEMYMKEHAINKHPKESEKNISNAKYSSSRSDDPELNYLGVLTSLATSTNLQNCSNIQKHLFSADKSDFIKTILDRQATDYAKNHFAKHVAKKTQDESIKKLSQSLSTAVGYLLAVFEIGSLTRNIYKIQTNKHMTKEQKTRRTAKEVCASVYGVGGSVLGQAFIPIPIFGSLIGRVLGNALGGAVGGSIFS